MVSKLALSLAALLSGAATATPTAMGHRCVSPEVGTLVVGTAYPGGGCFVEIQLRGDLPYVTRKINRTTGIPRRACSVRLVSERAEIRAWLTPKVAPGAPGNRTAEDDLHVTITGGAGNPQVTMLTESGGEKTFQNFECIWSRDLEVDSIPST